jgi:hypothetical protein
VTVPARAAVRAGAAEPVELARLKAKVDLRALIARGWDPERRVFVPSADDPLFGYQACERHGCPRAGSYDRARALGLCDQCARNYLGLDTPTSTTRKTVLNTMEAY